MSKAESGKQKAETKARRSRPKSASANGKPAAEEKDPEAPPEFELADAPAETEAVNETGSPDEPVVVEGQAPRDPSVEVSGEMKLADGKPWEEPAKELEELSASCGCSDLDDDGPPEVTISVPLDRLEKPHAYVPQHVDARLSRPQGIVLKRLLESLVRRHAMLPPDQSSPAGRHVQSYADAVRWLLEEIGLREEE